MLEDIPKKWKVEGMCTSWRGCKRWTEERKGGGIVGGGISDVGYFVAKLKLDERFLEVMGSDGGEHGTGVVSGKSGDGTRGTGWTRGGHDYDYGKRGGAHIDIYYVRQTSVAVQRMMTKRQSYTPYDPCRSCD